MTRRRGFALVHVLVAIAMLSAAVVAWRAAFDARHAHAARGHDRARARAVAEAAWARARAALAAGRDPGVVATPTRDGVATVRVEPAGGARRVVVEATVRRRDVEAVHARLVVDVDAGLRVLRREEGGAW
ncbi:MAG: hypothetical protein M9894_32735 [Planctomycetes bacterium]|nr:hypothetical protein [Planctomycetota bacterium]